MTPEELIKDLLDRHVIERIGPNDFCMPDGPIIHATAEVIYDLWEIAGKLNAKP